MKYVDGKKVSFGVYKMLKDAHIVRDALIRCDWDKSELDNICDQIIEFYIQKKSNNVEII